MSLRIRETLFAFLILFLLTGVFFHDSLSGSKIFVTTGLIQSDLMGFSYPVKDFLARSLRQGQLPFWSKDIAAGAPLLAEGQIGALYPLNLIFFRFLPMPLAFNLCLALHFFLAGLFTCLLVRFGLGRSLGSSLLAGVAFEFSGFLSVHLVHFAMVEVVAFLPLTFWVLIEQLKKFSWKRVCALILIFSLQILAGHIEILYFSLVTLGFFCFISAVLSYQKNGFGALRPFLTLAISLVASLLITSFQILPSLELTGFSSRSGGLVMKSAFDYLFPVSHLAYFVLPRLADFTEPVLSIGGVGRVSSWETYGYLGLLPLFLSIAALLCLLRRLVLLVAVKPNSSRLPLSNRLDESDFWLAVFFLLVGLSLLLSFGNATPIFEILWRVMPLMHLFQYPTRFLVVTELSLAVLAGFGADFLWFILKGCKIPRFVPEALLALLILIAFADLYHFNRPVNPLVGASWWLEKPLAANFLAENLGVGYRFQTLGSSNFDYRLTADSRVQKELQNLLQPNFNLIYGLAAVEGLSGLSIERSEDLSVENTGMATWRGLTPELDLSDGFMRLLSLRSGRFILSDLELFSSKIALVAEWPFSRPLLRNVLVLDPVTGGNFIVGQVLVDRIRVYENLSVLPRANLVSKAVFAGGEREALEILEDDGFDPSDSVVIEDGMGDLRGGGEGTSFGAIGWVEDLDQTLTLKVNAPQDGYLVLSDTYYPGWRAYVRDINGAKREEVKILRANYNFRAIPISQGDHLVTFVYDPQSFKKGLLISFVSLSIIVSLSVYCWLRGRSRRVAGSL